MNTTRQMLNDRKLGNIASKQCSIQTTLHVAPGFTGRVVVHLKDGRPICDYRLLPEEHIATLQAFLELAAAAEWKVKPPKGATL